MQELRQKIVDDNIGKLVKSLTKFEEADENYSICHAFAKSHFRHHNYVEVNSHEIQKQLAGLYEKFDVGNYERYSNKLKGIVTKITTHPLCLRHYQTDVHWMILSLLLELSYNPVTALTTKLLSKPNSLALISCDESEEGCFSDEDIADTETGCGICTESGQDDLDDSELSSWTETESEAEELSEHEPVETNAPKSKPTVAIQAKIVTCLQPPKRTPHYVDFDGTHSQQVLDAHLQKFTSPMLKSGNEAALVVPNYALTHEIFWMFLYPVDGVFFRVQQNKITVQPNVATQSIGLEGIQEFLPRFARPMTLVLQFRMFCKSVQSDGAHLVPETYVHYASAIESFIAHFDQILLGKERELTGPNCTSTVMQFYGEFVPLFDMLEMMASIHGLIALNWRTHPAHVCAAHLLAGLFAIIRQEGDTKIINMAFSMYLISIGGFLVIIDNWWTDGKLNDWREEFLVKEDNCKNLGKFIARSFDCRKEISKVISEDPITRLLVETSIEAGYPLKILYDLSGISKVGGNIDRHAKLYETFVGEMFEELQKFVTEDLNLQNRSLAESVIADSEMKSAREIELTEFWSELDEIGDEFLSNTYAESLRKIEHDCNSSYQDTSTQLNAYEIYNKLNRSPLVALPHEHIVLSTLTSLLQTKLAVTDSFVVNMFVNEFHVLKDLKILRQVFLLEASDLMYFFYTYLFTQIESVPNWANSHVITCQLDDILSTRFADAASLFSVVVQSEKCTTTKVLDAIDELFVNYAVPNNVRHLITEKMILEYNHVFRFLLKVKYSLCTLENLRFPISAKKRAPFGKLTYIDFMLRRLSMLRFWMIYSLQCIHSHLMTHVMQSLGTQLDENVQRAKNLSEMTAIHQKYINFVYEHCFQKEDGIEIRIGVHQLMRLALIVSEEWATICAYKDMENGGDATAMEAFGNIGDLLQVEGIENMYMQCHQYLANTISVQVYTKNKTKLAGLCAAFNCSIPY